MKHPLKMVCLAVSFLLFSASFAQKPTADKASLFTNYPSVISCNEAALSKLFLAAKGENIRLALPGNLTIEGIVKSNEAKYYNLQTMVISLPAFNNILFSLSKRLDADNSISYIGHLFNHNYADGYELKRNADKTYQLTKIETARLLPTCSQ